ncbi:hypothetical protein CEXT_56621 [Caerostris extrusa]|uniref:Uncharacterized protein n=1 Tax=Caerostris extrusa TaxID=172846 RepID=A0AAV4ULZ0_CAEEX|nr:hypothetical protein CEXT_56621 [Caerostris extrusa]
MPQQYEERLPKHQKKLKELSKSSQIDDSPKKSNPESDTSAQALINTLPDEPNVSKKKGTIDHPTDSRQRRVPDRDGFIQPPKHPVRKILLLPILTPTPVS